MNFIKKIYDFFLTRVGLTLFIAFYFIWHFPLTTSSDAIQSAMGQLVGNLISTFVVILALSVIFDTKWRKSQKALHTFLLSYVFLFMLSIPSLSLLSGYVSLISLGSIGIMIITVIGRKFNKKTIAK
ncbi:hypothetical protein HYS96_03100 [Candidatus Daviesbacteria bacterium]|nr:hypothetical protein [Candidatus Daviesbacteria bacterium]